jgi:hypothetical protein
MLALIDRIRDLFEGPNESRNDFSQFISTGFVCRLKFGRFEVMLDGVPGTDQILAQAQNWCNHDWV